MRQPKNLMKILLVVSLGVFFGVVDSGMPTHVAMKNAKATQQSMTAVSAMVEMYADEHLEYPGPTSGFIPVAELRRWLDPNPEHFPLQDAWGSPILYWSNGGGFMLVSFGSDRRADYAYERYEVPYEALARGRVTVEPEQDIVFVCGGAWQGPVLGERTRGKRTIADTRSISRAPGESALE